MTVSTLPAERFIDYVISSLMMDVINARVASMPVILILLLYFHYICAIYFYIGIYAVILTGQVHHDPCYASTRMQLCQF